MEQPAAEPKRAEPAGVRVMRNADLVVLALALPLFLATGLPLGGYAAAAGAWLLQRAVKAVTERRATASEDVRTKLGLIVGGMIARGWIAAGTIFGAGLANEDAGLSAAVLFLATFTVAFLAGMVLRPFDRLRGRP